MLVKAILLTFMLIQVGNVRATQFYEEKMNFLSAKFVVPKSKEQIADMLIMGFHGTSIEDEDVRGLCEKLKAGFVGGVILFSYNIENPPQVKKLISDLRAAAGRKIWVAIDQEGGKIQRLTALKGFTDYLSPEDVAKNMTLEQAYVYYRTMAKELADVGVNLNFGCVLDLHSMDGKSPACPIIGGLKRSYSNETNRIVAYASAFVRAHRDFDIVACLKHYPGHGLAGKDSHAGLVDVSNTRQEIEREPFRQMIKLGLADMIMTAHVVDQNVDKDTPISLSEKVLTTWLRNEDGFKGLIITDDLHMGAIGDHYTLEQSILKSISAGSDIVIISNNKNAAPNSKNFEIKKDLPEFFHKVLGGQTK